ncbi:MAG: alpha-2-macroglobulin family protein [Flavobacterium sp.]|nr:alpha-2-macroglobulin family protein [Flavobacterium sp.]
MQLRILLILMPLFLVFSTAIAQQKPLNTTKEWIEIDTLVLAKNQPKAALQKVNKLYVIAKANQDDVQLIKCLIYRINLEDAVFDNKPNNAIQLLESEIAASKHEIAKNILYSLLANRYLQYYNANRWQVYNRSKTTTVNKLDIETWNADDFGAAISHFFLKSIANASLLQGVSIAAYDALIFKGNATQLRPTLYDLLAHEALDYFKTGDYYLTKPTYAFELKDVLALSNANTFITTTFTSTDTASHLLKSLQLFQQLLQFHNNDTDKNAFVDVDLERIEWVYKNLIADKETAYAQALTGVTAIPSARTAQAYYLLANHFAQAANNYQPFGDTSKRFGKVKAMKIIKEGLAMYQQDDDGIYNLENLKQSILQKSITTQVEEVNLPNMPFRALVSFKNVDTLFVRIIKLPKKTFMQNNWHNADYDELAAMPFVTTFAQPLPTTTDYQQHSVEVKIDALPTGQYVLLTSSGAGFIDTLDKMSKHLLHVSNISYIKNGNNYFVLHRGNGKPLANVKVTIAKSEWNNTTKKTETKILTTKITNKNGYFSFVPKDDYGNYDFAFVSKGDRLQLESSEYLYKPSNSSDEDDYDKDEIADYEEDNTKVYFFTDRSIYRPGQTIYFKGIAITKDFKTKQPKVLANKASVLVYLEDANNKNIDSLYLKTNAYGSFAGKFILPQNVLTGRFEIDADDFDNSSVTFSVEEYKSPKFYVEFEPVKGMYRVNDSITITGFAKAYAGNVVDGAKVIFTVQRKARFVYDWLWRNGSRPYSGNRQITNGNIVTNAEGKFTITFKALPDEKVEAANEPIFDFTVSADVTDINGETRTANKQVSVGYKRLQLAIAAPKLAEADSLKQITISSKNMNGENEPANVGVKIYAIQTPQRLIRKRLWQRADMFVMDKNSYLQNFPNDDYEDELNEELWPVNSLVFEDNINTLTNTKFQIPNSKLDPGFYKIEATTTDKDGNTIKDVRYMQLFNRSATPYPQYNFNYTLNNYAQPNVSAAFISGSMAENTFVVSKITRPKLAGKERTIYQYNNYQKGLHSITYKADETDRGNVAISEAFVSNNRVYTNHYNIIVPFNNKALDISYTSFRNKTEPGSKETWTVNIAGNKGEKVAAELLTSMYDASLDQFKKHEWAQPNVWTENQYKNDFTSSAGFETSESEENYLNNYNKESNLIYSSLITDAQTFLTYAAEEFYRNAKLKKNKKRQASKAEMTKFTVPRIFGDNGVSELKGLRILAMNLSGSKEEEVTVGKSLSSVVTVIKETLNHEQAAARIRAISGVADENSLLLVIDGAISVLKFKDIDMELIDFIDILKSAQATALYGSKAINGVLVVTTKEGKRKKQQEKPIQPRKNFNETAFFFPQLYADTSGNYSFSFTMPEALTQWKWQTLAHTKDLAFGNNTATITTQKTLMVQANAPRFVREGDNLEFVAKLSNLSDKELTGQVRLELVDATTNVSVDGWFQNLFPTQYFTVGAGQSSAVKFPIQIPFTFNKPFTWRVIAEGHTNPREGGWAGADGEENTLPVLSNRMLVTESLPMLIKGDTTQRFVLDKLVNNQSETLTNQSLTVEYTANPVWTAVQALPYLINYPYECAEQTFNRYFANALAANIVAKHPRIKTVFETWLKDSTNNIGLLKGTSKVPTLGDDLGEALKQVLLQETPWVLQAENEAQQQKNIALLFDVVKMSNSSAAAIDKLQQLQLPSGGFTWFKGGREDRYITNYILAGIGKLKKIDAITITNATKLEPIISKALAYLDDEIKNDYKSLQRNKANLQQQQITTTQIQYLYMRSFFTNAIAPKEAYNYYYNQAKQFWNVQNTYNTAMIGLALYRNNERRFVNVNILPAITQNAVEDTANASVYWKDRSTCFWYASPIEHQSMLLQLLEEVAKQENIANLSATIQGAKNWLLRNKQTNHWATTVATADACYALLNNNSALANYKQVRIQLGNVPVKINAAQAGTGYVKSTIEGSKIMPQMGNVTITTSNIPPLGELKGAVLPPLGELKGAISYGSLYWQYFEDFDKITASASLLSITKNLFVEKNSPEGKILTPVNDNSELKVGDKVVVQLVLKTDRDMDYVHLKDTRAATMEPVNVLSEYKHQDGLGYYEATKDASTNFFFSSIRKGTYVFEYPVFITHVGTFSIGIASLQCMYAPEFTSHSNGFKVQVRYNN